MKHSTFFLKSLFFFLFLVSSALVSAQNLTVNVTQTPSCNNNGSATASILNGTPPYNIMWTYYDISTGNSVSQNGPTIQNVPGNTYLSVSVTDDAGGSGYNYVMMEYAIQTNKTTVDPTCNKSGSITLAPSGGTTPYTYLWSDGSTASSVQNIHSSNFSVTVTDNNNCFAIDSIYLNNYNVYIYQGNSTPSVCKEDGAVQVFAYGGTAPYNFEWNTGFVGDHPTNLNAGSYSVTATDAGGCTASSDKIYVESNNPMTITSTTVAAYCKNEGSATVTASNGTAPYSYSWNIFPAQTGNTATSLFAGPIQVRVKDGNECNKSFTVQVPYDPIVDLTSTYTESFCHDGTITISTTGGTAPYSYYWMTNPVQTGATATGLNTGTYTVKITDANGCTNTTSRFVPPNSILTVHEAVTDEYCENKDGAISLSVTGGQSPYTYKWLDNSSNTAPNASGLSYGWYTVVITDANTCDKTKQVLVNKFSPVHLSYTTAAPSCNNADGKVTLSVSGGNGPYTYKWNTGSTASNQTTLPEGYYYVQVKDANRCADHKSFFLQEPPSCYVSINGQVLTEKDGNCTTNGGDFGLGAVMVQTSPGYYTLTSQNGYYGFYQKGSNITLAQYPVEYFDYECPLNGVYNLSLTLGTSTTKNFYNTANGDSNDIGVGLVAANPARPGFPNYYYLYYYNRGNTTQNATITFNHDENLEFAGAFPGPLNYVGNSITFQVNNLLPRHGDYISVGFKVPPTVPLGTMLKNYVSIDPVANDIRPRNNFDTLAFEVTGAYDPNLIEVEPKGKTLGGYINKSDSLLKYTIHFQNTGTDTAFNIIVMDTLDANHEVASVMPEASSHTYTLDILPGNILKFHFKNILLPDSNANEEKSHGFVNYTVKLKSNRPYGTVIKNTADIYFDYNVAVKTNTVVNTIQSPTGIAERNRKGFSIYPNPMQDMAVVNIPFYNSKNEYSLKIYDILGHEVKKIENLSSGRVELKRDELISGVYFYQLSENKIKTAVGKLILK